MSKINVSTAQPRRLLYHEDQWVLELQRWQSLDRDLFAPVLSYISGPENILRYLGELDNTGHLLVQAERLLSQPGNPNAIFESLEGHWVAQGRIAEQATLSPQTTQMPHNYLAQILANLAGLEQRLERLELRLQGRIADNDGSTPSVRPIAPGSTFSREVTDDKAEPISQTG